MTEEPQTQINQGEIEVADNSEFDFDFDPDDEDLSLRSESDAAPTKRSFMWMWWVLAAVLFTTFAVFLSSASVGIVAHNQALAQASVKVSSGSKSGKSKCSKRSYARRIKDADFEDDEVVSNTDIVDRELDSFNDDDCEDSDSNSNAEEPDGDAVRAKYEGTVALGNLDCGSEEEEEECVQSVQNALKAALEELICRDLTDPLVSPCWVVVDPTPEVEVAVEGVTDEAGRRRLDLQSLWTFIASMTIAGPSDTEDNMDSTIASASAAISDVAVALAEAVGGNIEVILEAVAQVFEVLAVELSPDPYDWAAVIPDVTGYQLVGEGYCTSSLEEYYGAITYETSSVLDCVEKCKDSVCYAENNWTLPGVELEETRTGTKCYCLINEAYEPGDKCTDPDADFFGVIDYGPGTGQPWFSGPEGKQTGALCFRFIQ